MKNGYIAIIIIGFLLIVGFGRNLFTTIDNSETVEYTFHCDPLIESDIPIQNWNGLEDDPYRCFDDWQGYLFYKDEWMATPYQPVNVVGISGSIQSYHVGTVPFSFTIQLAIVQDGEYTWESVYVADMGAGEKVTYNVNFEEREIVGFKFSHGRQMVHCSGKLLVNEEITPPPEITCYRCAEGVAIANTFEGECPDGWLNESELYEGWCGNQDLPEPPLETEEDDLLWIYIAIAIVGVGVVVAIFRKRIV